MGTTLVPCCTFGNTRVLRSWHDPYGVLRWEEANQSGGAVDYPIGG